MQLFFDSDISEQSEKITFETDESKHLVKVLRKQIGDSLAITNGKGWLFWAEITFANPKRCEANIIAKEKVERPGYRIHLAVAPTKMNDRYEWFLEKATEIGVDTITPLICERSERRSIKPERFEKVIQSAMKQSLHCYLPKLNSAISFKEFVNQSIEGQKLIAHCEDTEKKSLKSVLVPDTDVTILIGPEGDFDTDEIALAIGKGYRPVTLGNSRLRTETAAVVACHSVVFCNEKT
ncbi:MAG TPA: 16S rRNA (uracil(1498)-N(3))-methyltransferase [Aquaticitalea sp.]|nr:16S rRNA (uracil(1498)-N(3))-methyltransferase [Aquaticitalea sp.]